MADSLLCSSLVPDFIRLSIRPFMADSSLRSFRPDYIRTSIFNHLSLILERTYTMLSTFRRSSPNHLLAPAVCDVCRLCGISSRFLSIHFSLIIERTLAVTFGDDSVFCVLEGILFYKQAATSLPPLPFHLLILALIVFYFIVTELHLHDHVHLPQGLT